MDLSFGHPGREAFGKVASVLPVCSTDGGSSLYHACQLGRHVHLPFSTLSSRAMNKFDLIHSGLWTSLIVSVSGFKYYLVILDDCSHHLWTFPLHLKSDTISTLTFCLCANIVRRSRQDSPVRQRQRVRKL